MSKTRSKPEVSPRGIFVYPRLNAPDPEYGRYSVKLRLSEEEAQPLRQMIDSAIDAQVEQVKNSGKPKVKRADPPYAVDEDTGDILFNFKMTASGTRDDGTTWTQKPGLKTASLKDFPAEKIIGGGSEGKVAFSVYPFYTKMVGAGVSLRLRAVQIFKLVELNSNYGFEAEDGDDFENSADAPAAPFDSDDDGSDDDNGEAGASDF